MQILKGESLKSVTVQHLLDTTDSCCYVYYDQELPFDSYYVNSNLVTLEQLQECLQERMRDNLHNHEYFIIYTNKTECELSGLITWLREHENEFGCRCLLLTCKS